MAFLHLNGWDVPIEICELSQRGIGESRMYSLNGLYQMQRNSFARVWAARTGLLTGAERDALLEMLGHRGDGWRWAVAADPAGYVYVGDGSVSEAWSNKFRPPQDAEAIATIQSSRGADGARVYDWNNVPVGPMLGCSGALAVEPGTTNLLSANEAHPTANGHLTNVASGTHAADSDRYWTGSGCVSVTTTATNDGIEVNGTGVIGQVYQLSAYVRGIAGGEQIVLQHRNAAGATIATQSYTLSSDTDRWTRVKVAGTQVTDTTVRLFVLSNNGALGFAIDGLAIEQQDDRVTSWVDPAQDFWGSGNAVRPDGVLDYDQWTSVFQHGITVAAWINLQYVLSNTQRIVQTASAGAYALLYISNTQVPAFAVFASDGSTQAAAGLSTPGVGLTFLCGVYDPATDTTSLYLDGALLATDSTWSGDRQRWDIASASGDFSIGSSGSAGTNHLAGLIGPVMVLPYVVPASVIAGWHAAAVDDRPAPGVLPIGCHGTFLQQGDSRVNVYAQVDSAPHEPWFNASTWEPRGGRVAFTLYEDSAR